MQTENDVRKRISAIFSKFGYNQNKLAGGDGATQKRLNRQLADDGASITANTILLVLQAFPTVSPDWLLNGTGDMLSMESPEAKISLERGVPYYNVDFEMGFDTLVNDQTRNPDFLIDCQPYNRCDAFCNAYGNSMAPTIANGDIVALKRIEDFRYLVNGEIYALVTKNGLRTIKRVNDNGDTVTLIPDNASYAPQTLPKSEIDIIYAVKGALKMF